MADAEGSKDVQYVLTVLDFKDDKFHVKYLDQHLSWTAEEVTEYGYSTAQFMSLLRDAGWSEELDFMNGYKPTESLVWTNAKSKRVEVQDNDDKATKLLLMLMKRDENLATYKSGNARGMWSKIATEMSKLGFSLGDKPREKVASKYRNLLTAARVYNNHVKETGKGKKDPPGFYDDVMEIEGDSHSICPPLVLDSLDKDSVKAEFPMPRSRLPTTSTSKDDSCVDLESSSEETSEVSFDEQCGSEKKKSVLPAKSQSRYSARKEAISLVRAQEKKNEEREKNENEHRQFIVEYLKAEQERSDKRDKERSEERAYRQERDKKHEQFTSQFLGLFGKLVKKKLAESESDEEEERKPKKKKN